MVNPVGFRFRPTDVEIIYHYLRLKNLGGKSSHLEEVMNTVNICSFDPWDLPSQSRIKTEDQVWYFFSRKEHKYNKGVRQIRKTKSGFWKKTGVTMDIMGKNGTSREKIGEKRVLVFHWSKIFGGSKSNWVMHEYHSTCSSPDQMMMTYTICKVQFKGEATEIYSYVSDIEHSQVGLTSGSEGSSSELLPEYGIQVRLMAFVMSSKKRSSKKQFKELLTVCQVMIGKACLMRIMSRVRFVLCKKIAAIKTLTNVFVCHSSESSDANYLI